VTQLDPALAGAFADHLLDGGLDQLDAHIRAGGDGASYITGWVEARDQAARDLAVTPELAQRILALPARRDGEGYTVREFLLTLLTQVWDGNANYGLCGNSDWRYAIYEALLEAGVIVAWRDGYGVGYRSDGTKHPEDEAAADRLIHAAIAAL
jgi:hypothetical protein